MNRGVLLPIASLLAGCGLMPSSPSPEPATAPRPMVPVPGNWAFWDLPSIDHLVTASDEYIAVTVSGEPDTVLAQTVANAQGSGWKEKHRKDAFDGYTVFFDGIDGSQLSISTTPRGAQVELTAINASPQ
jgi:hypothetical protein